ncbi:glucokinase [mine drainage metagenome]|uniref:Glucokinase n=1 Tax=mine drainage metagenome TaxID=410659 RepID=A0A1J5RYC4_9ZZZZ
MTKKGVYLGTDSGATTSKTGGVWEDGTTISQKLQQSSTNSQLGTAAVIKGWMQGVVAFMEEHKIGWDQVKGVGLAIPGPYLSYGVLGRAANLPAGFEGWNFHADYSKALSEAAGRPINLVVGNDGRFGGVAEAARVTAGKRSSVLMVAPGSGLGCAYINQDGLPLDGDTLSGMEGAHMPAPLHLLGARPYPCGCGRTWGCIEAYTTISGLPHILEDMLKKYPNHELASSTAPTKEKVLSLRTRAQKGDPLALEIFDFQAKAMGLQIAALTMALDTEYVVVGGGLMDPESTTPEFRERYLENVKKAAAPYLWPTQRKCQKIVAATLGELSQSIGAALVAMHTFKA